MTSVTPICSNDSAAVEVVARSNDDIRDGDIQHRTLLIRIDYICIGEDGHQVSGNLQVVVRNLKQLHTCCYVVNFVEWTHNTLPWCHNCIVVCIYDQSILCCLYISEYISSAHHKASAHPLFAKVLHRIRKGPL